MTAASFAAGALRSTLVLVVALAALGILRRRSAAVRHIVLAAGIFCAAAAPLLSPIVPSWGPVTPVASTAVLVTLTEEPPAVGGVVVPRRATIGLSEALVWVWASGASCGLLMLAAGLFQLRRIARRSAPASQAWVRAAADLRRALRLRRDVTLLQTASPSLLVTWGVARPAVFLPAAAASWTRERVRIVLAHELAHVRRADWAVQVGAMVVRSLLWFNPLVWIACRRLADESEQACDDQVLALGIAGASYADHLVELARVFRSSGRSGVFAFPAPAIAKPSSLERRVRAMLQLGLNRSPLSRTAIAAAVVALAAVTVPLAGFGAAQNASAAFTATLVDTLGRVLPDVPVTMTNTATSATVQARTNASGRFSVADLAPGDYELSASLPGFGGKYRVVLSPGSNVTREIPLQIGTVQETINVRRNVAAAVAKPARPAPEYHPESDPCRTSAVGGCIAPPLKVRDVRPEYPATDSGATIRLHAVIGTDGFVHGVTGVDVAPADDAFARSAVAAVSGWQFTPTRLDGVAVETQMNVTVTFVPQQ